MNFKIQADDTGESRRDISSSKPESAAAGSNGQYDVVIVDRDRRGEEGHVSGVMHFVGHDGCHQTTQSHRTHEEQATRGLWEESVDAERQE